jgi:hypothetical protein
VGRWAQATSQKGAGKKEASEEPAWNRDGRRRIRGHYNDHQKMIKMIKMMSLSKQPWENEPKKKLSRRRRRIRGRYNDHQKMIKMIKMMSLSK